MKKKSNSEQAVSGKGMTTKISIRVDTDLVNEAMRVLGAKSKTEAIRQALSEAIEIKTRFATRQDYVMAKLEEEMARLRPHAARLLRGPC